MPTKKKLKTPSAAREGPPPTERLVIDLTCSKRKKYGAAKSKQVTPAMLKIASMIVDRITQRRSFIVPLVSKLATMKSDKVDYVPLVAKTGSPTEKEVTTRVGNYEKSNKPVFG
ncbi:hypothetical protein ACFX13_038865 [Malus domestica]